jgi:hypothetical protein
MLQPIGRRSTMDLTVGRPFRITDRCQMFNMSMGVFEHIVRGAVVYLFLLVLLRFVGKKHVGELAPFDLLVLLILSDSPKCSDWLTTHRSSAD